ncbi:energy-coupling factor ABC transporter ATP-binding protein [Dehalococcoidales bacterium]|nr:energy-coupling factor ABC transporter ATP-binding protein [Dehalococcoidales bacterium]
MRTLAIKVENLTYVYQPHSVVALDEVSFEVGEGEFVAIIGQNGVGKTTLLKNIAGLLKPIRGRVLVEDVDTNQSTLAELSIRVGLVLQNPDQQLFAQTVEEEIAFGPRNLKLPDSEVASRVEEVIAKLDLECFRQEFPLGLTIGDRLKVVIASVLAMRPRIILLDEPTIGQDYRGHRQTMDIVKQLHQEGKTIVIATHHMNLVAEYAQRVIVLCQGKILLDDTPATVFSQPEVLRQTHIAPPQITQLAQSLPPSLGFPRDILTVREMGEAVLDKVNRRLSPRSKSSP